MLFFHSLLIHPLLVEGLTTGFDDFIPDPIVENRAALVLMNASETESLCFASHSAPSDNLLDPCDPINTLDGIEGNGMEDEDEDEEIEDKEEEDVDECEGP